MFKKLWQIFDEAFKNVVVLFQRQESVVKKSRHQCAIDKDLNVFPQDYLQKKGT